MPKRLAFGLVMVLALFSTTAGAQKPARAASPPDGYLCVLTDEDAGAVLRVEPAQ